MRKQGSFWPTHRSLFRSGAKRRRPLAWITFVLSVAAAWVWIALSRDTPIWP